MYSINKMSNIIKMTITPIEKRKINKHVISVLSVLFITTYNSVNNQIDLQVQNPIIKV
jgi:hypothetical protein